jgi:sulfate transport system ATP-binding protein
MTFVGAVSRLGDEYVRPHDLELTLEPNGTTESATVQRVVYLGFEVRAELELANGGQVVAQATPAQADELGLHDGQTLFVRPSRTTTPASV